MRPRVGLRNFVSRLKQVVLPAPFGPISAWMVPRATRRPTPLTATNPANSLVRSSVSRMMSSLLKADIPLACHPLQVWPTRSRGDEEAQRHVGGSTAAAVQIGSALSTGCLLGGRRLHGRLRL